MVWGDFVAQIASYPETIKDTMGQAHGVPQVYILPERLFDISLGVSRSEIEFPIYFNFYLNQRKTILVCRRHQLKPVMRVLQEAIFGPTALNLKRDYAPGIKPADLKKEMAFFKKDEKKPGGRLRMRDMVEFAVFDDNNEVTVSDVKITMVGLDRYRFTSKEKVRELSFRAPPKAPPASSSTRRYRPPFFGVTVIGSGHGFDPSADTSGFIIWVNGRGILVDPPVDTTQWLRSHGVDSRLISDLILTHCHADHDAGTLQKLLEEGRVRLHTPPTIIDSFIRKYRGLVGLVGSQLRALFDFIPVTVNEPVNIAGAAFFFRYNFHPVPTLGFSTSFQGKTFAYSGDHLNDAEYLQKLHDEGLISKDRLKDLLDFEWHADLILHEAGIPPIHTPVEALIAQPDDVKELGDGATLELAGVEFLVDHTPGHTRGSVTFRTPYADSADVSEVMFSGDLLFAGSIGRTDLPGGDHPTMLRSLATKVLPLADDVVVLPGHGEQTSIGRERATNPYLLDLADEPGPGGAGTDPVTRGL